MKLLFLGIGNAQRGDDALGPHIAEALLTDPAIMAAGVDVLPHGGEGVSLMDLWEGQDRVVVVDAMKSGAKTGTILHFDVTQTPLESGVFHYSSHLFGLAEAVEMSRALDRLPRQLLVIGVEGKVYDFGAPFSRPVQKAVPLVLDQARRLLLQGHV